MNVQDTIAAMLERAEKATPGNWWADKGVVRTDLGGSPVGNTGLVIWQGVRGYQPKERVNNADFIAASRTDIPKLVRALQRVVEDVARQKAIKDLAISVGQEHDDACALDFILEHIPSIITEELGR